MVEDGLAITRSKKLITDALFDLLQENPFRRLRVTEICRVAGVSRPTFYAHFETADDVIRDYFDKGYSKIMADASVEVSEGLPAEQLIRNASEANFEYWKINADKFKLLKTAGMEKLILETLGKMDKFAYENFGMLIDEIQDPEMLEFFLAHLTNSYYLLIDLWIKKGMKKTPREMVDIHLTLTSPYLITELSEKFPLGE